MPDFTNCYNYGTAYTSSNSSSRYTFGHGYYVYHEDFPQYNSFNGFRGKRSGKKVKEREFLRRNNIETVVTHRLAHNYAKQTTVNKDNIITLIDDSSEVDVEHISCKQTIAIREDATIQHPDDIQQVITGSTTKTSTNIKFANWRSMTLNVQSCSDKFEDRLDSILELASKKKISLLALTEFRRRGKDSRTVTTECGTTWDIYWSGHDRKRLHGVAIAVKRDHKIKVLQISQISPRMMWIDLQYVGLNIRVYCLYAPTNCPTTPGNETQRSEFWRRLQKEVDLETTKTERLFLGDFNSTTTLVKHLQPTGYGRNKCYTNNFECNENGEALTSFCVKNSLGMLNTYFKHKLPHLITFHSNDGHTTKTLDYALATQTLATYCHDCRVKNNYLLDTTLNTDHRCLIQRWAIPLRKQDRRKQKSNPKTPKIDYSGLKEPDTKQKFTDNLIKVKQLNQDHPDINSQVSVITEELDDTADKVLVKKSGKNECSSLPWRNDEELKMLKAERNKLSYPTDKEKYRLISRNIKKRADLLKSNFYKEKADNINEAAISRDLEKLFRVAKDHGAFNYKAQLPSTCTTLKEHFKEHFNKKPPCDTPQELIDLPEYLNDSLQQIPMGDDMKSSPPDRAEIVSAINKLKHRKATTDTPSELLQALITDTNCLQALTTLYTDIWQQKELPNNWKYSRLKALYKKGKPSDPNNYRGLSISSTQLKILCVIILRRLENWYESSLLEGQFGFRTNRGCQDAIYCLRRVHQIFYERKEDLYVGFIDLKAAFDWIPREWMFSSMNKRNVQNNNHLSVLLSILELVYTESFAVITGDVKDEAFQTTSGVRQGGCESPYCFNLYLDFILRIFEYECQKQNIQINLHYRIPNEATNRAQRSEERSSGVLSLLWFGYADDLAILTDSAEKLQQAMEIMFKLFQRYGLQMSLVKTRTMIMTDRYDDSDYPESICVIENQHLENVRTFIYLGQKFAYNEPYTPLCELQTRKFTAINSYYLHENLYKNHAVALTTRRKIFDSLFRSKLAYSCQTWSLTESSLKIICSTYNLYLRNLVRGGQERKLTPISVSQSNDDDENDDDDDHDDNDDEVEEQSQDMAYKLTNEQVHEYTKATPMKNFVENQQLKWFAHIVRSSNNKYIKKLTFIESKSKRKGRPLKTLERTIYQRLDDFEPTQIRKLCFERQLNS